jgi:hypothetical protein
MAKIKLKYINGFANRDRKSLRTRYYFRRRGTKAIPLPGVPGSEELMAASSRWHFGSTPRNRFQPDAARDHQRARCDVLPVG